MSVPSTQVEVGPPSLLGSTIHRAAASGRFYLIYGVLAGGVFGAAVAFSGGSSFTSSFPLFISIFAVVGSLGGLTVFSTDRLKGVLEYLMAYGVSPRRVFANVLVTALVLTTIVLAADLAIGVGLYVARGNAVSSGLVMSLTLYTIPMSYASAAFCATIGMFWTSLSSPRTGMNSPIGLAPFIGILPSLATVAVVGVLAATVGASTSTLDEVALVAIGIVVLVVVVLLSMIGRLLARERLLSPA